MRGTLALLFLLPLLVPVGVGGGQDLAGITLVVDAGHGGNDPGASGFGLQEKTVTLDVALRLRDLLEAEGATVLMTRTTDATVSLADRVAVGNDNGADRFVSIHANACGACGGHGTETYYHDSLPPTSTAADLAAEAQAEVVAHLGTRDRGVKTADFYVLRETNMPAVLVETAFIDEAGDNALLADPAQRQEIARALLHGIQSHFGIAPHDPPVGDTTPPTIRIDSPDLGVWQSGTITVAATISDPSGIQWARSQVDAGAFQWDSFAPHRWTWDTTAFAEGDHDLRIQAKDNADNQGELVSTLRVDNLPPTVDLVDPVEGEIVVGWVTVRADAQDAGSGVDRVDFLVDDVVRSTDREAPYNWFWFGLLEPGFHTVAARATDASGKTATESAKVLVV